MFLLVPFALVGIALVIVLLILELTIATGMLHGLIFYANVVAVNYSIFIQPGTFKGLTVFLAWVNLDLGIESCFSDGLDQYTKTWLQFVFPVYLWILVAVIIVVSHYSSWVSKLLGHNPVAVLATIILLSYTMMLRKVLSVFSYAALEYPDDRYMKVWLYDGNLDYLQGKHAVLFTFSFLVLIVLIVPYTLLLLLAQLLQIFLSSESETIYRCLSSTIQACSSLLEGSLLTHALCDFDNLHSQCTGRTKHQSSYHIFSEFGLG